MNKFSNIKTIKLKFNYYGLHHGKTEKADPSSGMAASQCCLWPLWDIMYHCLKCLRSRHVSYLLYLSKLPVETWIWISGSFYFVKHLLKKISLPDLMGAASFVTGRVRWIYCSLNYLGRKEGGYFAYQKSPAACGVEWPSWLMLDKLLAGRKLTGLLSHFVLLKPSNRLSSCSQEIKLILLLSLILTKDPWRLSGLWEVNNMIFF